jgi:poly(3-hydroxybutyrate) depolymerase
MADTGGFLSGLSSGEKMMAMTSLSGAAEGWMAGESAEDAAKAQEEAFNRIQLNSDSDASTGLLMSSDTSFQPSTSTQLNSSSKVQKPTIRRPTVKGSSYVTA